MKGIMARFVCPATQAIAAAQQARAAQGDRGCGRQVVNLCTVTVIRNLSPQSHCHRNQKKQRPMRQMRGDWLDDQALSQDDLDDYPLERDTVCLQLALAREWASWDAPMGEA